MISSTLAGRQETVVRTPCTTSGVPAQRRSSTHPSVTQGVAAADVEAEAVLVVSGVEIAAGGVQVGVGAGDVGQHQVKDVPGGGDAVAEGSGLVGGLDAGGLRHPFAGERVLGREVPLD